MQQYDHYSMSLAFYSFFCLVTVGLEEASQRIAPEFKQALESLWLMPLHNYVTGVHRAVNISSMDTSHSPSVQQEKSHFFTDG